MAIEFTCPSGHRLSTKDDDAGKMAKCPKCGAITKVPGSFNARAGKDSGVESVAVISGSGKGLADYGAGDSGGSKSGPNAGGARNAAADSAPFSAAAGQAGYCDGAKPAAKSRAEETIIFLCPNGHKLNAPRKMQGHAGKCPECGAKFRIPFMDDGEDSEGSRVHDLGNFQEMLEIAPTNPPAAAAPVAAPAASAQAPSDEFQFWDQEQHPLAAMVMRLWSEREHGGVIELHLTGGAILLPDWFDRRLSQGAHGLFASQAADGTVTMTIVPWETVTRVVVRGVVGLPDGMFE